MQQFRAGWFQRQLFLTLLMAIVVRQLTDVRLEWVHM